MYKKVTQKALQLLKMSSYTNSLRKFTEHYDP